MTKEKKLSLTLNGDLLTTLTNGERRDFKDKLLLALKILLDKDLLTELGNGAKAALAQGLQDGIDADTRFLEEAQRLADERRAALHHTAAQEE